MTRKLMLLLYGSFGLLIFSACSSASGPALTPVPSAIPQTPAENKILPTPVSAGQRVVYDDLQVTMNKAEITTDYLTEYGSTREPPVGKKFLWINLILQNIGQNERNLPAPEHFSALSSTTEFKPTYGHRKDYADYMALTAGMLQGQDLNAWLRFDIPDAVELKDLQFAFLPESSQVSVGFSSNDYPWGDHPIYLWTCAP